MPALGKSHTEGAWLCWGAARNLCQDPVPPTVGPKATETPPNPGLVQTAGYRPETPLCFAVPPLAFAWERVAPSSPPQQDSPKPPRPTAPQPARTGRLGTASLKLGPWRQSPEPEQARSLKRKGSATAANPAAGSAGTWRPWGGWPVALGCSQERQASHGIGEAGPGWDEHGTRKGVISSLPWDFKTPGAQASPRHLPIRVTFAL